MSKKRHPNECPICEKFPCRCPGGGADEEKPENDTEDSADSKRNMGSMNNTVNASILGSQQLITAREIIHSAIFNQKNQLLYCMFFAETTNQSATSPSNDLQEDNASDATITSSTMGMKMGDMGE